ncbi:hypothetical protein BT96DRAFT_1002809 [Gymnopus androsaceus JB14]|uniref:SET domain-containing protein n=1 Tax=Gymnopus androsaceus JB14 TaxID=1447944 RepID=A0A6A4GXX3_9AGAR|nr:hypothetical protein BT96DRAFT_1002809 [Gymnopus androsaceus JB14]
MLTDLDITEEDQLKQLHADSAVTIKNSFKNTQSARRFHYYACTPVTQNIREESYLPSFIPHSDNPHFEFDKFLEDDDFAWPNLTDPDGDIIEVEVARCLHYDAGFDFEEINDLKMLRLALRQDNENGLLWENSQRDLVHWESQRSAERKLPRFPKSFIGETVLDKINAGAYNFCPNLNCITSHCWTHYTGFRCITNPFERRQPEQKHEGLFLQHCSRYANDPERGCGRACFMTHNEELKDMTMWSIKHLQDLAEILDLVPDASPCDLAVIVYHYRREILPDENIFASQREEFLDEEGSSSSRPKDLAEFVQAIQIPGRPQRGNAVTVHQTVSVMLRDNIVSVTVDAQMIVPTASPGVSVEYEGKILLVAPINVNASKNPENVTRKSANVVKSAIMVTAPMARCTNANMQQGKHCRIEIKASKYGQGAFACNKIEKNTLIGGKLAESFSVTSFNVSPPDHLEYVAEIKERSLNQHELVNKFRGLNYDFEFENDNILNGATAGNETRYLNDPRKEKQVNCEARYLLVNNDWRIGLYSTKTIKKGSELFLGYGEEKYWKNHAPQH